MITSINVMIKLTMASNVYIYNLCNDNVDIGK